MSRSEDFLLLSLPISRSKREKRKERKSDDASSALAPWETAEGNKCVSDIGYVSSTALGNIQTAMSYSLFWGSKGQTCIQICDRR